ncbi:hypothetical protein HK102_004806 [Quaeritorhiza haematococci]|nr:hypothetical protein HK102_004806 [Quaeritorhiza haematococci]
MAPSITISQALLVIALATTPGALAGGQPSFGGGDVESSSGDGGVGFDVGSNAAISSGGFDAGSAGGFRKRSPQLTNTAPKLAGLERRQFEWLVDGWNAVVEAFQNGGNGSGGGDGGSSGDGGVGFDAASNAAISGGFDAGSVGGFRRRSPQLKKRAPQFADDFLFPPFEEGSGFTLEDLGIAPGGFAPGGVAGPGKVALGGFAPGGIAGTRGDGLERRQFEWLVDGWNAVVEAFKNGGNGSGGGDGGSSGDGGVGFDAASNAAISGGFDAGSAGAF